MEQSDSKKGLLVFGGISGIIILLCFIAVSEVVTVLSGGDTGAMLWTAFHFAINPILCAAYIVLTIIKWGRVQDKSKYYYPVGIAVALLYIYFSISGNTLWLDLFGINFNT